MAHAPNIEALNNVIAEFNEINIERLSRPDLGKLSLGDDVSNKFTELSDKVKLAQQVAIDVHNSAVSHFTNNIKNIVNNAIAISQIGDNEYVQRKQEVINTLDTALLNIQQYWPSFVTATIEKRGILEDEGLEESYKQVINDMQEEATKSLELIKEEAKKTIGEAKTLAEQIENKARKTAVGISVEDAQKQFSDAKASNLLQIIIWSVLSVVLIVSFILSAYYFFDESPSEKLKWFVIYYTAIRITVLTAIGGVATYCLKVLRANLHMYQHNFHRERLANSMSSFVESASTPEQRDLILSHLVDAIASFGHSGLIQREDDQISPARMTVDTVTRSIIPPEPK